MSPALIIQGLTKRYGSLTAVDRFSLELRQGTVFGLLGPNGAGKTTLIKMLTTLMRPTSGDAFIQGESIVTAGKRVRALIGVVPQENNLDRYLTAQENLVLHARLHGMAPRDYLPRIDRFLELTGLSSRRNDFPDTFSGGMQRRLVVVRALIHLPRLLFLDEPTTGLDPQSRRALWEQLRTLRSEMTIFLTTHYMDEADSLCDRIVIMDHGASLVDGSAQELKERYAHAHIYELELRRDGDRYEELFQLLPQVTSLERERDSFRIVLRDEESLKPLMDSIPSGDIRRICLVEPSLEEVFLDLTGKMVRE